MKELDKNDLKFAFESSRCNNHTFDEWYEYNYGIKEPKDGEVWMYEYNEHSTCEFNEILGRFHRMDDDYTEKPRCYSFINRAGEFDINSVIGLHLFKRKRPATPEEISKLEKAERENGYWWNGEELVELEYIRLKDEVPTWGIKTDNRVFKVGKYIHFENHYEIEKLNELINVVGTPICYVGNFEPATKEEYEAQNNKTGEEFFEVFIDYKAKYYELKKELERLSKL